MVANYPDIRTSEISANRVNKKFIIIQSKINDVIKQVCNFRNMQCDFSFITRQIKWIMLGN